MASFAEEEEEEHADNAVAALEELGDDAELDVLPEAGVVAVDGKGKDS